MDKRPYHHGRLEEALIEAGLSLVDRDGLEGLSLRRVAAACGVSHAAPYKHFAGKEDLLSAMQRFVEDRFADTLQQSLNRDEGEPDYMLRMATAYLRFFMESPHYFSFFQRQGDYRVSLDDMDAVSSYRPFEIFKRAAMASLEPLDLSQGVRDQTIVAMWAMVHGYTAIAVMGGVAYRGDWTLLLQNILKQNLGLEGSHFEKG